MGIINLYLSILTGSKVCTPHPSRSVAIIRNTNKNSSFRGVDRYVITSLQEDYCYIRHGFGERLSP